MSCALDEGTAAGGLAMSHEWERDTRYIEQSEARPMQYFGLENGKRIAFDGCAKKKLRE